jgi:cell division septum initiation protein DivIVA
MKLYSSESDDNDTTDASTSKSTQFSSKKASVGKDESSTIVTEEMVLEALENAEKAWEAALEARKTANALIDRAEEEAEAASVVAQETEKMVGDNQRQKIPVTMQQLAQVDRAANASLDATNKVNRAVKASEEADRLEKLAENALQESERLLDDHLKAFPDSPLAEDEND